jgi:hypothetical protein
MPNPTPKKADMADEKPATAMPANTIDLETAARLAMCTPRWIQELVKQGFIPKAERGRYTVLGVVHGRIKSLQDDQSRSSKSASATRVQDARAEEIKLRTDEKRGALLEQGQAEAIAVIDEFVGPLKSDLLAIPARVTADLALRRRIEDGIDEAFAASGKRASDAADRVATVGPNLRKAAKVKPRRVGKAKSDVPAERGGAGPA